MLPHFFPVIFYKYWYFSEYFGMYLFLPVINKGLSILNQNELNTYIHKQLQSITLYMPIQIKIK